jgi:ribonuclease BN (tRNA processing enzyme)
MRLTTIGTGTISFSPGRVCAGHLVEAGAVRLLLDCGSGVVHRMAERGLDWWTITHVALTHFHLDHHADLPSLIFAWRYGRIPRREAPVEILGPPGTAALVDRLAAAYGDWVRSPEFPLAVREVAPGERAELPDGMVLEARKVPHTEESVAYSIERGGRRIVYSGDTAFDPALGVWATGCDVLLCECSLPEAMAVSSHLTPRQAAAIAAIAQPRLLALTHLYPPVEQLDLAAEIGALFAGEVAVCADGWSTEIEEG